ncbi:MAG TPA: serine/threonine-protein kinase [Ktedonobacteraceae bacterium]
MADEQAVISVGTLVRGRYAVKSVLGTGRTGAIYLVKDQKDQEFQARWLVLKEIKGLDQKKRYNFIMRGSPLLQLHYPGLPRVYTLFNDDKRGCVYLVMEYVEGERLAEVSWSHLSGPELCTWFDPLVATLSYLHHQEQPFFHGNLKPANIVYTKAGRVMLLDPDYLPYVGEGESDCYHAPEQFAGLLDERSDVYGCGALLYSLLSGEEPANALARQARIEKKKTDRLVPVDKVSTDIPHKLSEVLQRALALDPAARFASIKEFWEALRPLLVELNIVQTAASNTGSHTVQASRLIGMQLPGGGGRPADALVGVRSSLSSRRTQRWLLPMVAAVAALLLLLLSAGTWTWGAMHGGGFLGKSSTTVSTTAVPSRSSTSTTNSLYTRITGKYGGYYDFYDQNGNLSPRTIFTLAINEQHQNHFSGVFSSPALQHNSVTGLIDQNNGVDWTVVDSTGDAILNFTGGLNGIFDGTLNTQDSMGGILSKCVLHAGAQCVVPTGPGSGGSWVLNFEAAA